VIAPVGLIYSRRQMMPSPTPAALALLVMAASVVAPSASAQTPDALTTVAERSAFARTGRFDEVQRLCTAFAAAWPKQVRCLEFGKTPEQRPMLALVASADGTLTAAAARSKARPVVLMQGGIHAGEIDGKDAGFQALREILQGTVLPGVLDRVTLVFVPVFNVDGHERVGRANRPNQTGPEEVGWRVTSQNLNLNRDYVKADAPEMQAMLRLLNEWDPILYADLHVTDGAQFEHDVSFNVAPTLAGDAGLRAAANGLLRTLLRKLTEAGSLPLDFYPSLNRTDDPASGFTIDVGPPRFSHEYWGGRRRIGVLVETHSWKPYPVRVRITRHSILTMLEAAAADGVAWRAAATAADDRATRAAGTPVVLRYRATEQTRTIDFRGYAYRREPSPVSGALVTRYDPSTPQIWRVPLFDQVAPSVTVDAPRGGYVVPAGYAGLVAAKLALHGIESRTLAAAAPGVAVQTFRATKVTLGTSTFEGRTPATLEGSWAAETRDLPAGSLFVPIAQPNAWLLMTLLEPSGGDSLVGWGFFNVAFERREYMEAYVAEQWAREAMAKDTDLRQAFEKRLAEDPAFVRDPAARLDFFYRRHPAFDERFNLYPIYRSATVLP
jgi:murein tripeptide amidase MpaA